MAISTFVGRDEECARLGALLQTHRMVTVVGPGGMGKTRLADAVSPLLAARFPGGVRRSELAQVAAGREVGIEIAGPLGFSSLEALTVALADAPSLLVLDNCEHLLDVVARLCERLLAAAPPLRLLATSREPLGIDGEEVLLLGPLALPASDGAAELADAAAMRLFDDRARAAGARREAAPVELAARAELCRRLDGVPLAIELAAARARALTAVELLALLDRRFDLLQRDAPVGRARHRSLRAAIDTSYALLDAGEQAFFRALGAFSSPFSAQLAHDVAAPADADRLRTIDALSRLVDRSLVTAEVSGGVTRYRLLESLRAYAAEHARAAGEWDALMERFVAAMVAEADRIVAAGVARWSEEVLASVLVQHDALVAALEHTLAVDADGGRAFRLLLPLWGAIHQGRAASVGAVAERALSRWPAGDEPLRAEALAVAATALLFANRVDAAHALAQRAAAAPSPVAQIVARRALGILANNRGDAAGAVACFRRAADTAVAVGLAAFARELTAFVETTALAQDDLDAALARLEAAATEAASARDPIGEVWARLVVAFQLLQARRLADARAAVARVRQALADFDYPYGTRVGHRLEAALVSLEQGWPAARPLWLRAIDDCAAVGELAELAFALRDAAAVARGAGDGAACDALLAALPAADYPAVLGTVIADRSADVARRVGGGGSPPASLARVRELLTAAPSVDADSPTHTDPESQEGAATAAPRLDPGGGGGAAPAPPHQTRRGGSRALQAVWLRAGDVWTLHFAGKATQVRHLKGLDDLAALLARPEQEVHCLELVGGGAVDGDRGPVLDEPARRAYQARIRELQTDIDAARAANDLGGAERAEAELEALVQQLSEAFGLGGRGRPSGSSAERARSTVAWRIRAAIKRIRALHPELARHLDNAVRTGTWCSYRPEAPVAWQLGGAAEAQDAARLRRG